MMCGHVKWVSSSDGNIVLARLSEEIQDTMSEQY
jgi:hypothetical protein